MPIIPTSANKVLDILNIDTDKRLFKFIDINEQKDFNITNPKPIFPRIDQ